MNSRSVEPLRVGFVPVGRQRGGFDPDWGRRMDAAAWEALGAVGFEPLRPSAPVVDDGTLRGALSELKRAGCRTIVVLQPTMGDGRLAPMLAQLWGAPLVLWATPERPDAPRVTACSLVGTHVFASTLRQLNRPFEIVSGPPQEDSTRQRMAMAVQLAAAAAELARAKVGLVGGHAPGFVNLHADPISISRHLGVELHHFGLAELQGRIDGCDAARVEHDVQAVLDMGLPAAEDLDRDDLDHSDLVPNSRYWLALSDLIDQQNLDAVAVRCWPELPDRYGHWPYLALMRLAEHPFPAALEGDVDGAILGLMGNLLGIGVGYISDWLEHDAGSITLWHPGHAPREICVPETVRLGRHFNNDRPLVVNAELAAGRPITIARLWRCDGGYRLTAFPARTDTSRRPLLGAHGTAVVDGLPVPELFDRLCHAGVPHHVSVFQGDHVELLRRLARLIDVRWFDAVPV